MALEPDRAAGGMNDTVITLALEALPALLLALLLAALRPSEFRPRWLVVALLLIVCHELFLTRLLWQIPWTVAEGRWNWLGKLLALAGTLAIVSLPAFGWRRSGITLRQAPGSWPAWLLAFLLCLWFLGEAALTGRSEPDDAGSIAFMWTIPGPEEEAFYRGVLLLALNEAFTARRRVLGADLGWAALLTSVQFGAVHAVSYSTGEFGFNAPYFAQTFLLGLVWVWMRERTGSILAPALSHNIDNGLARLL